MKQTNNGRARSSSDSAGGGTGRRHDLRADKQAERFPDKMRRASGASLIRDLPKPELPKVPVLQRITSCCAAPGKPCKRKGKRNADKRCATTSAPRGAAPPPPSSSLACGRGKRRGRLACRRSTTALAAATERHRSASATRLPRTGPERTSRWFERRSASQRAARTHAANASPRVLPAPSCPSPARLHPRSGHDAVRACLAETAREHR
jgi:hypothetical protein